MKEAGAEGLIMVPDTWFFPGKTGMALTAHFPPTIPLACVGGNNAPKPGVVGIDALVGAWSGGADQRSAESATLAYRTSIGTGGTMPKTSPRTRPSSAGLASAISDSGSPSRASTM